MQITEILNEGVVPAEFVDSRTIVRTDAQFGEATVDFAVTDERIREMLLPMVGGKTIPVVTGFIASTEDGLTTTLGRSGSDYTASIVGAALESEEIWIWTDVDGVMTADPRFIKGSDGPSPDLVSRGSRNVLLWREGDPPEDDVAGH